MLPNKTCSVPLNSLPTWWRLLAFVFSSSSSSLPRSALSFSYWWFDSGNNGGGRIESARHGRFNTASATSGASKMSKGEISSSIREEENIFLKKKRGKKEKKKKKKVELLLMCSSRPQRTCKWNESIIQSADAVDADAALIFFFFFYSNFFFSVGAFNSFSILFFSDELKWTLEDPPLLNQFQTALCVELSNYYFALGSVLADAILHLATIGQSSISLWWRSVLLRRKHNDFIQWKWWIGRFHTHFLIVTSISMAINSFKVFNHQRDLNSFHLIGWLFVEFKVDGWLTAQVNVGFCSTDCI